MASEEEHTVYNDDDLEDDDDNEPLNDVVIEDDDEEDDVVGDDSDSDTDDADPYPDADTNSTSSIIPTITITPTAVPSASTATAAVLDSSVVTLAIPAAVYNGNPSPSAVAAAAALTATTKITTPVNTPDAKRQRLDDPGTEKILSLRPPTDDSRRLFQRLWTDEDEIELLQGFLDYTTQRGTTSSGHHDTTVFYDQIKSKLQLDFNKNQLVEKLRRLKKKYRNIVNRISSGKDFVFKSAHDQTTFEISRKIWSNSAIMNRQEFDDDDHNPNPSNSNSTMVPNSINLNSNNSDQKALLSNALVNIDISSSEKNLMGTPKSKKRSRVKMEEKSLKMENLGVNEPPVVNVSSVQVLIEETVRSCLSPLLKELINNAVTGSLLGGGKGIGGLASNTVPLNFSGVNLGGGGEVVDEKWRKQQILELEVYSKRLELVQDQIKSALKELRSMGS